MKQVKRFFYLTAMVGMLLSVEHTKNTYELTFTGCQERFTYNADNNTCWVSVAGGAVIFSPVSQYAITINRQDYQSLIRGMQKGINKPAMMKIGE